jgi:hypothetical protein
MSTSWYAKIDSGFHANRKSRKAGRLGRELFVFVLCQNAARGASGVIPAADIEVWYLADQLQMTEAEAAESVRLATAAGLIQVEGEEVRICGWDDSWGKLPSSNADRQARFRERHGAGVAGRSNARSVTRNEDAVTSNDRSNAVTQEGRKEGREGGSVTRNARAAARPLPSEFQAGPESARIAADRQLNLEHELAQFRDWTASRGLKSRDWDAEFRKWLRESKGLGANASKPAPGGVVTSRGPVVTYQRTTLNPLHFHEVVDGEVTRVVQRAQDGSWQEVEAAA